MKTIIINNIVILFKKKKYIYIKYIYNICIKYIYNTYNLYIKLEVETLIRYLPIFNNDRK